MRRQAVEELLFSTKASQALLPSWRVLDDYLAERGLDRYCKTISVSYTDADQRLVAAAHPDAVKSVIEVAIALPRSTPSDRLYDAALLRWRDLPVAFAFSSPTDIDDEIRDLINRAIVGETVESFDTSEYVSDRDRRMRKGRDTWAAD